MDSARRQLAIDYYHGMLPDGDLHGSNFTKAFVEASGWLEVGKAHDAHDPFREESAHAHALLYGRWAVLAHNAIDAYTALASEPKSREAFIEEAIVQVQDSRRRIGFAQPVRHVADRANNLIIKHVVDAGSEDEDRLADRLYMGWRGYFNQHREHTEDPADKVKFVGRLRQGAHTFGVIGGTVADRLLEREAQLPPEEQDHARVTNSYTLLPKLSRDTHLLAINTLQGALFEGVYDDGHFRSLPTYVSREIELSDYVVPVEKPQRDGTTQPAYDLSCPVTGMTTNGARSERTVSDVEEIQPHIGCPYSFLPAEQKRNAWSAIVSLTETARELATPDRFTIPE